MQIEFENRSKIESISTLEEPVRSKRYAEFIEYYRRHPYKFCERFMQIKLYWYQKVWIWIMRQLSKLKIFKYTK